MDIIATYPSVVYHVYMRDGTMVKVDNPLHLPDPNHIEHIEEPFVAMKIISPKNYIGGIMALIMEKRGICAETETVDQNHVDDDRRAAAARDRD